MSPKGEPGEIREYGGCGPRMLLFVIVVVLLVWGATR